MIIYISGQITGLPIKEAFENFEKAEKELKEKGYKVVNPMKMVPFVEGKTWKEYMADDIELLLQCDGICMLNNWQISKGARIEKAIANEFGLWITFM